MKGVIMYYIITSTGRIRTYVTFYYQIEKFRKKGDQVYYKERSTVSNKPKRIM